MEVLAKTVCLTGLPHDRGALFSTSLGFANQVEQSADNYNWYSG